MKIVIITAWTPTILKFRLDMIRKFVQLGHEVVVLGDEPEEDWSSFFEEEGVEYRSYSVSRNGVNPLVDLETLRSLKKALRDIDPDKVFTYQAKPNIYGLWAAHAVGVEEAYPMMGGIGSVFMPQNIKQRIVRAVMVAEYKLAFKYAKKAFFQNPDDAKTFRDLGIIDEARIVYTNGSGVNVRDFVPVSLPDRPSFIFVGRLIKDKGVYEYLQACRMLKEGGIDAEYHLVGDLDSNPSSLSRAELDEYIEDGSIMWHGWQDDIRPYLAMSSVFVLPSYREGTPKAALEAMAMGRAVITTDTPGCREVVPNKENGLLVPAGDAESLASSMALLASDSQLVQHMGHASRRLAEEVFDVDKVNESIISSMRIVTGDDRR